MEPTPRTQPKYVVAVSGTPASRRTLACVAARAPRDAQIIVVHSSDVPVSVRNGPKAAIASQMGGAPWTTVYATAREILGNRRFETVVDHQPLDELIAQHSGADDTVVLGGAHVRRLRRLARKVRKACGARVVAVADGTLEVLAGETADLTPPPVRPKPPVTMPTFGQSRHPIGV